MSANEVIEQIEKLAPEELARVIAYVKSKREAQAMTLHDSPIAPAGVRYMDRERARELSERIFEENDELFRKLAQ